MRINYRSYNDKDVDSSTKGEIEMTREEMKQHCLDQAGKAENGKDAKDWIEGFCSLEKNELSAEKNASDYESARDKAEKEAEIEEKKIEADKEAECAKVRQQERDSKRRNWLIFIGTVTVAVIGGIVKKVILEDIKDAEQEGLYVNGNKYNDRQFG